MCLCHNASIFWEWKKQGKKQVCFQLYVCLLSSLNCDSLLGYLCCLQPTWLRLFLRKQSGKNVQFEKEDKGSSQENAAFDDSDPSDGQIAFTWLMVNGSFLILNIQNKNVWFSVSKSGCLKSNSTSYNLYFSITLDRFMMGQRTLYKFCLEWSADLFLTEACGQQC